METHSSNEIQNQLDFVEKTVKLIKEQGGRSYDNDSNGCVYKHQNGKACAVGIWFKDGINTLDFEGKSVLAPEVANNLDNFLKEEAKDIPLGLWDVMQSLHDDVSHWEDAELSYEGRVYLLGIKDAIEDGQFI